MLLTHLIRQNGKNVTNDNEARQVLESILDKKNEFKKPLLKAASTGWYSQAASNLFNPLSCDFEFSADSQSVCFTESTLAGLKAHSEIFGGKYGVAFSRDFLFNVGACPCINLPASYLKQELKDHKNWRRFVYNYLPQSLTPFVNIINENFDATHEREWRIPNDFHFSIEDILFIFCPTADFRYFSSIQKDGLPYLFDLGLIGKI